MRLARLCSLATLALVPVSGCFCGSQSSSYAVDLGGTVVEAGTETPVAGLDVLCVFDNGDESEDTTDDDGAYLCSVAALDSSTGLEIGEGAGEPLQAPVAVTVTIVDPVTDREGGVFAEQEKTLDFDDLGEDDELRVDFEAERE